MHLTAESILTKERLRKFSTWTFYRRDYSMKILLLLLTLFVAVSWSTYLIKDPTNTVTLILLIIELAVLVAMYSYPLWSAGSSFRSRPLDRLVDRFTFDDDGFVAVNDGNPDVVDTTKVRYEGLHLVVEGSAHFYFFTDRLRAFIVYKTDFAEGDVDALGAKLQELLGSRYVWDR